MVNALVSYVKIGWWFKSGQVPQPAGYLTLSGAWEEGVMLTTSPSSDHITL